MQTDVDQQNLGRAHALRAGEVVGASITDFSHGQALAFHVTKSRDEHAILAKSPRVVLTVKAPPLCRSLSSPFIFLPCVLFSIARAFHNSRSRSLLPRSGCTFGRRRAGQDYSGHRLSLFAYRSQALSDFPAKHETSGDGE